jgi:Na+/proline symporter
VAALFWRKSTKWGALASTVWAAASVAAVALFQYVVPAPAPGHPVVALSVAGVEVLSRTPGGTAVFGFMPVVPMTIISAALMIGISLVTARPSKAAIARYWSARQD